MPADGNHFPEGLASPLMSYTPSTGVGTTEKNVFTSQPIEAESLWQVIKDVPEQMIIETLRLKEFLRVHPELHWRDRNIILGNWSRFVPFALMVFLGLMPEISQSVGGING